MKAIYITVFFSMLLIVWSCSDIYDPDDIDASEPVVVVQGIIQEGQLPEVTLTYARKYGEETPQYISSANIWIEDKWGNSCGFTETSPGKYSAYCFVGQVGNSYKLSVELSDGNRFESTWEQIEKAPKVDSLYAEPGEFEKFSYNSSGDPIIKKEIGLHIKSDLGDDGLSPYYYRFNTKMVKLMVKTEEIGTPASHGVYMWETHSMDNNYSVDYSTLKDYRQLLLQHDIGFLNYFYDVSLETETSTAPFTEGWVVICDIYSVSQDVYIYYNSIDKQLNPDNHIFAPSASQIKSNISYVSGSLKKVAGVFEACAKTRIYMGFAWKSDTEYKSKLLDWFPDDVGNGSQLYFPPYFWVYF